MASVVLTVTLLALFALTMSGVAVASTTIGSDLTGTPGFLCPTHDCTVTNVSAPGGTLTAPSGGVVTRFRIKHAAIETPVIALLSAKVLSGTSPNFTVSARSGQTQFQTTAAATEEFVCCDSSTPTPSLISGTPSGHPKGLPISAGNRVGVYVGDTSGDPPRVAFIGGTTGHTVGIVNFDHLSGPQAYTVYGDGAQGYEALIQATTEPDVDADGYGDETQDNCPSISNDQTSNPCPPKISIDDATVTEGNVGTTNASFHVTLDHTFGSNVTVDYKTMDGSAIAPGDYAAAATTTLTFTPGQTSKTVTVPVNGDTTDESDEAFTVDLSNSSGGSILDNQGTGTITDDDTPPSLSISDATVTEGNAGTTDATFHVTLSSASGKTVQVTYQTADGSATVLDGDYTALSPTVLTFNPGDISKDVIVVVNGDTQTETNETFNVNLSSPSSATLADGTGVGTITDDDGPPTISIDDVTVTEGNSGTAGATFHVTLDHTYGSAVQVTYQTADDTATAASDYAAQGPTTLTFSPGQTSKDVTVAVDGDTVDEANETFHVNLSNPQGATIADGQGTGTITDDDPTPAISLDNPTVSEGNSGTVNAVFHVVLSAPSGRAVQVTFQTFDYTAKAPDDYNAQGPVTLTFLPGETSKTVAIVVNGDAVYEGGNESFYIALTSPANATITYPYGVATITEDDSPLCRKPALRAASASSAPAPSTGVLGGAGSAPAATTSRSSWHAVVLGNARSYTYGYVGYDGEGRRHAAALGSGLWYFNPSGVQKKVDAIGANHSFGFGVTKSGTPRFGYGGPWSETEPHDPGTIGLTDTCRVLKTAGGPDFTKDIVEASHIGDTSAYTSVDLAIDPKGSATHLAYSVGAHSSLYYRKVGAAQPVHLPFGHVAGNGVRVAAYGGKVAVAAADDRDLVLFTHGSGGGWVKRHIAGNIGPSWDLAMGPDRKPRLVFGKSGRNLNMFVFNGRKVIQTNLQAYEMALAVDRKNLMHVAMGATHPNFPILVANSIYYMKLSDAGKVSGLSLVKKSIYVRSMSIALSSKQAAIAYAGNYHGLLVSTRGL